MDELALLEALGIDEGDDLQGAWVAFPGDPADGSGGDAELEALVAIAARPPPRKWFQKDSWGNGRNLVDRRLILQAQRKKTRAEAETARTCYWL